LDWPGGVVREIRTLAEAQALCGLYCIPEAELARRASEIAAGVMREVERGRDTAGDTCPHYGGDYWFHFGEGSDAADYLCNIPPCPPGYYLNAAGEESYYQNVLEFLKARNTCFARSVAYFSVQSAAPG
jgi:hypothetical protein